MVKLSSNAVSCVIVSGHQEPNKAIRFKMEGRVKEMDSVCLRNDACICCSGDVQVVFVSLLNPVEKSASNEHICSGSRDDYTYMLPMYTRTVTC